MSNYNYLLNLLVNLFFFRIYGTAEEPLFLAKDVADWIGYDTSYVNKMINNVDEDEKVKLNNTYFEGRTGGNGTYFLTEDGLYEVLMQSRKPIFYFILYIEN